MTRLHIYHRLGAHTQSRLSCDDGGGGGPASDFG